MRLGSDERLEPYLQVLAEIHLLGSEGDDGLEVAQFVAGVVSTPSNTAPY